MNTLSSCGLNLPMLTIARILVRAAKILVILVTSVGRSAAACLPIDQALNHLGETQCVTGKVVRVTSGAGGVHYLDFCEISGSAHSP
jgi:hypothetical protein